MGSNLTQGSSFFEKKERSWIFGHVHDTWLVCKLQLEWTEIVLYVEEVEKGGRTVVVRGCYKGKGMDSKRKTKPKSANKSVSPKSSCRPNQHTHCMPQTHTHRHTSFNSLALYSAQLRATGYPITHHPHLPPPPPSPSLLLPLVLVFLQITERAKYLPESVNISYFLLKFSYP